MNTFLTSPSFEETARNLDPRRLLKQAVEVIQIINALEKKKANPELKVAWGNHPAVLQWQGYEECLKHYYNVMRAEHISRGGNFSKGEYPLEGNFEIPWFCYSKEYHFSHQAALLRKDFDYYSPIFPDIDPLYVQNGYIWPSKIPKEEISSFLEGGRREFLKHCVEISQGQKIPPRYQF